MWVCWSVRLNDSLRADGPSLEREAEALRSASRVGHLLDHDVALMLACWCKVQSRTSDAESMAKVTVPAPTLMTGVTPCARAPGDVTVDVLQVPTCRGEDVLDHLVGGALLHVSVTTSRRHPATGTCSRSRAPVGNVFVKPKLVVLGSCFGLVSLRMFTVAQLLRFAVRRGDEVLERSGERVRGAALEVGASEGDAVSGTAGKGVEVDLCLAEGARRDAPQDRQTPPAGIALVLTEPVASPASGQVNPSAPAGKSSRPRRPACIVRDLDGAARRRSPISTGTVAGSSHPEKGRTGSARHQPYGPASRRCPRCVMDWLNSKSM